ncbi:class II histocompatibility antigen, B-L beta chain-like isoform X2 [Silurus meridionalis]|uniref:class II histocompatibility antigen, B-L beta chain-like isoform X2 n=1 Tax=Silurus meridionalis TaxID=175797 RepID=UPI001EEBD26A|nr:class II histocompatibility antigen, B-L beta chain-like isoform X2 [Silurus meridionalis]
MKLCALNLCLLLASFTFKAVDGYYKQILSQCHYTRDLVNIEFIQSLYFNMAEYLRYNSTTDRYTGFTVYGARLAESLNLNPKNNLYSNLDNFCRFYRDRYSSNVLKKVKPDVVLRSLTSESDLPVAKLMCSLYDYHPKGVNVTWLRHGMVLKEGVSSTEELSDGDWYYQFHTFLEYTPRPGENISCMVKHESLTQPLIYTWDPPFPVDKRNKLIIGIFFLILGIVLAVSGCLYYLLRSKKKKHHIRDQFRSFKFIRDYNACIHEYQ